VGPDAGGPAGGAPTQVAPRLGTVAGGQVLRSAAWQGAARFLFFHFSFVNDLCVEEFIRCDEQTNIVRYICEINFVL
jgi:hypothetical protein